MSQEPYLLETNLDGKLPLIARGKVRDIYQVNDSQLLFVATDRISAYDVVMNNGIPNKGKLLTKLSEFWFEFFKDDVKNHLSHITLQQGLTKEIQQPKYLQQLVDRSLIVNKYKLVPLEVIVRGYLTGSAWSEYKKHGTVHGTKYPPGFQESHEFESPIFTPSTKAENGQHDENISIEKAIKIVGSKKIVDDLIQIAILLYKKAKDYAKTKNIIIADTKFEFGLDDENNLVLVDEVLTPDSSRFWNLSTYKLGQGQDSYDKQFLRNWLTDNKLRAKENVTIPDEIVTKTMAKYVEAYEALTGDK
ncbi:phosphoribosylaminoimidazolesuccinocarboxamide synthase [Ascoidea rubescens DSM 1968]|uniref:Phosphoribosylaminoimidazole-succinocarboxamide synthase n=1 Tax=Ascoidea rubescens DSM 1968 TaxID=1344418 RepID=A0A1D2VJ46_9ASCO|nr:phosphoribosylaminoimidazolesuccinocarboxamide synthetase [Ascoidea rubescens DSM 1968]ODV61654.1 phosphoribosylaminoimidazolesuccinocarboxamide synthetase [Ascoidea rubescens DSM 1968]